MQSIVGELQLRFPFVDAVKIVFKEVYEGHTYRQDNIREGFDDSYA